MNVRILLFLGLLPALAGGITDLARAALDPAELRVLYRQGQEAFEKAMAFSGPDQARAAIYQEAIHSWEKLEASGLVNGHLYYNLGNAHFRRGDLGQAIAYYHRALRLLPGDPDVQENLRYARTRVADQISPRATGELLSWLLFWHFRLPLPFQWGLAVAGFSGFWLLMILGLFRPLPGKRPLLGLGALLFLVFTASGVISWRQEQASKAGVLTAPEVVVRKGDADTFEPQFSRPLHPGVEFTVREERGEWLRIELDDGSSGWIRAGQARVF